MDYKAYEQKCMAVRTKNDAFLDEFSKDLQQAGLKDKTIEGHCKNVDFYINSYLLMEQPLEMVCGTYSNKIADFLGDFFIRKCMWSTPSTIKSTAVSIRKFYSSMLQRGYILESNYAELNSTINENLIKMQKTAEDFFTTYIGEAVAII